MKFSSRSEYGLRAIVNLAQAYPAKKSIAEISREEHISPKYLERLMGTFRRRKIVTSFKGKEGGYVLARKPAMVSVGEVVEVVEGSIAPMKCAGDRCRYQPACCSSAVWVALGKQIRKTLYGIKLSSLIKKKG